MADFTLTTQPTFPNGTEVKAYPIGNWPNKVVNQDAAPIGTATDTQTVANGAVTFTGLTDRTEYVAHATVNSLPRYIRFMVGFNTVGSGSASESGDETITGDWTFEGAVDFTDATVTGIAGFDPDDDQTITGDWAFPATGFTIGDTNLYRSATNTLKTDDIFIASELYAPFWGRTGGSEVLQWTLGGLLLHNANLVMNTSGNTIRWAHADNAQTTVGAAGGASALPATPTKYLKVLDSAGTTLVIPAYAAS